MYRIQFHFFVFDSPSPVLYKEYKLQSCLSALHCSRNAHRSRRNTHSP